MSASVLNNTSFMPCTYSATTKQEMCYAHVLVKVRGISFLLLHSGIMILNQTVRDDVNHLYLPYVAGTGISRTISSPSLNLG